MQLQQFVTETIENLGGAVIPMEYALCHVLIPEEYAPHFQNRTEWKLSFDFEVAQENPDSEFVTFGSYMLEQLWTIVHKKAKTAMRYAVVDRLELGKPLQKIAAYLQVDQARLEITGKRPVLGTWAVFHYHITFIADERTENTHQTWVNLLTNKKDTVIKREQNRIMYHEQGSYSYPIPAVFDMEKALQEATKDVHQMSTQQQKEQTDEREIARDIERINHYYDALIAENEKRANRKGLTTAKQTEIRAKTETIKLERDKQLQEIHNKANGEIEINLDHVILYFIPLQEYTITNQFRETQKQHILYYNAITKDFF